MSKLLTDIELYMRATKIPQTRFGRLSSGDHSLVEDMQHGRILGPVLEGKVRAFMAANPERYTGRKPWRWLPGVDAAVWAMMCDGVPHREIADAIGTTRKAVGMRACYLMAQRCPERARKQRLLDALAGLGTRPHETLLRKIEVHLEETGMTPEAFGWAAGRDPRLVSNLRQARTVNRYRIDRAKAYLRHGIPFGTGKRLASSRLRQRVQAPSLSNHRDRSYP